jgi:ABC-2 type transport system ATP-binding protein
MKQCLKLAQAIAHDPQILILDEVLAGCDPLVKHHLKTLLQEFGSQEKLVILSSHNLQEVESISDEVIMIDRGQLVAQGKIHELHSLLMKQGHSLVIQGKEIHHLARALLVFLEVVSIKVDKPTETLTVEIRDPLVFSQHLCQTIVEGEHFVSKIAPLEEDLVSLFRHLVN